MIEFRRYNNHHDDHHHHKNHWSNNNNNNYWMNDEYNGRLNFFKIDFLSLSLSLFMISAHFHQNNKTIIDEYGRNKKWMFRFVSLKQSSNEWKKSDQEKRERLKSPEKKSKCEIWKIFCSLTYQMSKSFSINQKNKN